VKVKALVNDDNTREIVDLETNRNDYSLLWFKFIRNVENKFFPREKVSQEDSGGISLGRILKKG